MQTSLQETVKITERYRDLQGLRMVVAGLGLLGFFAVTLFLPLTLDEIRTRGVAPAEWGTGLLVVDLIAMVVAVKAVSMWYDRRYGRVALTLHQRRLTAWVGGLGAASFLVPFEIEIIAVRWTLPVNVILIGLSCGILAYWLYLGRAFVHYLVLAGCGFALTTLSIAGVPPNGFASHLRVGILFFALATIAGGLIDHRILARSLAPRREVDVDS